ncbi:uncharacterized protein LOC114280873 [Camellia sinensis]|uniref:uncharacterized protein LOC114280873 n=1 Tax=Camellia sinensis TaxID=4442 RepID=UPI0010368816|nr:uncharacterized protein LOC114280873 [Camellia sinensis]
MAPYEALYDRKCRSPICWTEVGNRVLLAPKLVQTATNKIKVIEKRLKTAQSRQKSYADVRRRPLEYEVGDHVFIRVNPMKGQLRCSKIGKLSPRHIGPSQILKRHGLVALPPGIEQMHNVFHVSMLRGYLWDLFHVIDYYQIALNESMKYKEWPKWVIDRHVKQLRNKTIPIVKVEWKEHYGKDATWENEEEMQQQHPHLFPTEGNISLGDQTS